MVHERHAKDWDCVEWHNNKTSGLIAGGGLGLLLKELSGKLLCEYLLLYFRLSSCFDNKERTAAHISKVKPLQLYALAFEIYPVALLDTR